MKGEHVMQTEQTAIVGNAQKILQQVRRAVVGKDKVLMWTLAAILAGGHILLEDIPGVGKTTMALAFSKTLSLSHNRVQFTPDVLPSDVTGYSVINQNSGELVYKPGAVLCNLFLADELNRATSRTQSALLEAMEEGQVTVDGVSHKLPTPFVVIATQNPTGAAGTQLLPDSQMDRFMVRLSLGYPSVKDEIAMVTNRQGADPLQTIRSILSTRELAAMQQAVADTYVAPEVIRYVVELIAATRDHAALERGASPRATLAVTAMSKAIAQLKSRDFVVPKDVQEVFPYTVTHRLLLTAQAQTEGISAAAVLQEILGKIPAPKLR